MTDLEIEKILRARCAIKDNVIHHTLESVIETIQNILIENNKDYIVSNKMYIATMAMQGLIAVGYTNELEIAKQAYLQADKLLEQELE